jgi:hypothetical protein
VRKLLSLPTWVLLAGLVLLSTLLRAFASLDVSTPVIGPDEQTYAQLGQSIYEQGRFELWGQPNRFYTLTYPLFVGLALAHGDIEIGYAALKVMQALAMSLTAVPVYLWGRRLMSRGAALAAAALVLVIPGLAYSGLVMTEVLFLPIATCAAWACAAAFERPTVLRQVLAATLILVACATRLQAIAFAAAVATALLLFLLLERRVRELPRFWPATLVLGGAALAWAVYRLGGGGKASELFAAYRAAGDVSYTVSDMARFTAWHLADAIMFTGVVPAVALALLLGSWRQHDVALRAFLAVATSFGAWLVLEVGVFASRNVGHIAERDLLALVPLLFLALFAWIDRGAPRPRVAVGVAAVGVAATVLYVPVERFVTRSEFADAFTIVPLVHVRERFEGIEIELIVTLAALLLLAAALVVPRRLLVALPLTIALLLGAASVSASGSLADDASALQNVTTGQQRTWVDDTAPGDVTMVWSGDLYTIAPWSVRFWNKRLKHVVKLQDTYIEGPVPQPLGVPAADGQILVDGTPLNPEYALTSSSVRLLGTVLANGGPLTLWRVESPLRISHVVEGIRFDFTVDRTARVIAYGCDGGTLSYKVTADGDRLVELLQSNVVVDTRRLANGETWEGTLPALSSGGVCTVGVRADGVLRVERFGFDRA